MENKSYESPRAKTSSLSLADNITEFRIDPNLWNEHLSEIGREFQEQTRWQDRELLDMYRLHLN